MKDQVLSVKQMSHLRDLGVDISKASMCWLREPNDSTRCEVFIHDDDCYEMSCLDPVPAFTVQDLLEIIPCTLFCDKNGNNISLQPINYEYRMSFYLVKELSGYEAKYEDYITKTMLIYRTGRTVIEALYNILCWLAENNLLEKDGK